MAYTNEQLIKAKNAKSVEELKKLAEENGVNMSLEELEKRYKSMHTEGEISDDELDNVAGGCGGEEAPTGPTEVQGNAAPCGNYSERSGGCSEDCMQFYTGYRCQRCRHFSTSPNVKERDSSWGGGVGYCFYGLD